MSVLDYDPYSKKGRAKSALRLDFKECTNKLSKYRLPVSYGHVRYSDFNPGWIEPKKTFAIIRNPWSREYSKYRFIFTSIQREDKCNRGILNKTFAKNHTLTFEEYLFDVADHYRQAPYVWLHACETFYPQLSYVTNDAGEVACDILRFENYNEDINKYLGRRKLGHVNNQKLGDYREAYNEKLIQRVADLYLEDLVRWGYDFDTGPTKNYWNIE